MASDFDIKKGDKVEVLKAFIKASSEELECPVEVPKYCPRPSSAEAEELLIEKPKHEKVIAYKKVHEKMILVVKVKVVRMKHIEVKAEHCEYKPEKCEEKL